MTRKGCPYWKTTMLSNFEPDCTRPAPASTTATNTVECICRACLDGYEVGECKSAICPAHPEPRPAHASTTAPAQCQFYPCGMDMGVGDGTGQLFIHGSWEAIHIVKGWLKEAATARQAREHVLEELEALRQYANGEYKEADLSDNEREMQIHLEYENRIWGIMRQQQGGTP